MSDRPETTRLLLPRSHMGFDGTWLMIAIPGNPVIRLDALGLDSIDADGDTLLLEADGLVTGLPIADGPEAARCIAAELRRHTRGAPIANAEIAAQARRYLEALASGLERPLVFVGDHAVVVRGPFLQIGDIGAFRIGEVEEYGEAAANLPLPEGGLLQAALACLVIAASERSADDERRTLSQRIGDYQARLQ